MIKNSIGNNQKFRNVIKEIINNKTSTIKSNTYILDKNNLLLTDSKLISNTMNDTFNLLGNNKSSKWNINRNDNKLKEHLHIVNTNDNGLNMIKIFEFKKTNKCELENIISTLKNTTTRDDNIRAIKSQISDR